MCESGRRLIHSPQAGNVPPASGSVAAVGTPDSQCRLLGTTVPRDNTAEFTDNPNANISNIPLEALQGFETQIAVVCLQLYAS